MINVLNVVRARLSQILSKNWNWTKLEFYLHACLDIIINISLFPFVVKMFKISEKKKEGESQDLSLVCVCC